MTVRSRIQKLERLTPVNIGTWGQVIINEGEPKTREALEAKWKAENPNKPVPDGFICNIIVDPPKRAEGLSDVREMAD